MHTPRDAILGEVRKILEETGVTASRLAKVAGIQPSTLNRFLNNENAPILSNTTMFKIRAARDRLLASDSFDALFEGLNEEECKRALLTKLDSIPSDRLNNLFEAARRAIERLRA